LNGIQSEHRLIKRIAGRLPGDESAEENGHAVRSTKTMKTIVTLVLALACVRAPACSCVSGQPPEIAFAQAKAVFLGRVVRLELVREKDSSEYELLECILEVVVSYKGNSLATNSGSRRFMQVRTGSGGGDCGFPFGVGQYYLVYAYGRAALETDICTRTKGITSRNEAELDVLRRLGKEE
jgi:hypothetical protein